MKKKLMILIFILIVLTSGIGVHFYNVSHNKNNIQAIKGQKIIRESTSPNGKYTVSTYLNGGGATTDNAVLGVLKNNSNGKQKNIYWQYPCKSADIEWVSEETVKINGVQLDVTSEVYDYRKR